MASVVPQRQSQAACLARQACIRLKFFEEEFSFAALLLRFELW